MHRTLLIAFLAAAGCRNGPAPAPLPGANDTVAARADTVEILAAVWRVKAAADHRVLSLYLPRTIEPAASIAVSDGVRAALWQRGIPAEAVAPAGRYCRLWRA